MATRRTIAELDAFFEEGQADGAITPDRIQDLITTALVSDSLYVVRTLSDLPDAVGDEITLPANKTVLITGSLNLGSDALRLSEGTVLRGLAGDLVTSSNANGVIRATNLGAAVVMREFNVLATGGPCLALTGSIDHQLNLFFVGLLGASIGTVSGFDVQAFKDCYFNAADGIINTGTTNKVFYSQCPFYGITAGNAAITLAAGLNAGRIDMVNNFFKHSATGIPLKAVSGYTVGYGRVTGTMLDGPTAMLSGLTSADDNWWFYENDVVRNSRVAAQAFLTTAATTVITTQDVYVPVTGGFTVTDLTQRFELNGSNQLVYTGGEPVLCTFNAAFSVDPSNNDMISFRASKNGTTLEYSQTTIQQGAGPGASPRSGAVVALIEVETGDTIGLSVANRSGTDDIPWVDATYAVMAG